MNKTTRLSGLEERVEEYFKLCDSINEADSKKIVKPYTMSGLLYHIGLTKHEFDQLSQVKKYSDLLRSARARIEAFIEEKSLSGELSINASQGSLKYYFGWGEKGEITDGTKTQIIQVSLSDEARELAK